MIRLVPPMTSTDEEVDRALSILHDGVREASKNLKKTASRAAK